MTATDAWEPVQRLRASPGGHPATEMFVTLRVYALPNGEVAKAYLSVPAAKFFRDAGFSFVALDVAKDPEGNVTDFRLRGLTEQSEDAAMRLRDDSCLTGSPLRAVATKETRRVHLVNRGGEALVGSLF